MIHASIQKQFSGRTLVVATMHGKEAILRPVMAQPLGVTVVAPGHFNTDLFGAFSGEVERSLPPLETARKKCDEAAARTGADLVLASEGCFGAHPVAGFLPANEEWLLLKDYAHDKEYRSRVLTTQTNFAGAAYEEYEEAAFFLTQVSFPSHAVILRKAKGDNTDLRKGIHSWEELRRTFRHFRDKYGTVFIETDMRAHFNPTRQKVIREAGEKLLAVLQRLCPVCEAPGFAIADVVPSLPCSQCHAPTRSVKAYRYLCQHCGHQAEETDAVKKMKEDPLHCDECNP